LRSFQAEEVVAVEDATRTLRYARVIAADDDAGDDDDADGADGSAGRPAWSETSAGLRRVRVHLGGGVTTEVLASALYSFKAARERPAPDGGSDGGSPALLPAARHASHLPTLEAPPQLEGPSTLNAGPKSGPQSVSQSGGALAGEAPPLQAAAGGTAMAGEAAGVVGEVELLAAVESILARANLSLKAEPRQLMAETLKLQRALGAVGRDLEASRVKIAELSADFARVPDEFRCPITCELMEDPVICGDGHTYERSAIVRWLGSHGSSPKTNARLQTREVLPNHNLKAVIATFKERRGI